MLDPEHTLAFAPAYERMTPQPPSTTSVSVIKSSAGHWTLRSSGARPSLVVVADANFPGWKARVDGRRVPVLEADGAFISVAVGPGDHEITFDYGPGPAALAGRLITFGTLLALVIGGLIARSRRRRQGHALEVGTPPVDAPGQEALGAGQGRPGLAVADGKGPGRKGDEAVLAPVDDGEPGAAQHGH